MAITYKKLFHLLIDREMTLAELQKEILDTVHTYLRKGKKLIYSTCTMNPAENEENVRWFINMYHWSPWKRYVVC